MRYDNCDNFAYDVEHLYNTLSHLGDTTIADAIDLIYGHLVKTYSSDLLDTMDLGEISRYYKVYCSIDNYKALVICDDSLENETDIEGFLGYVGTGNLFVVWDDSI